jgi:hypothetical protein
MASRRGEAGLDWSKAKERMGDRAKREARAMAMHAGIQRRARRGSNARP